MKTKIIIMAFLIMGLLLVNVAKSQRNNTQSQDRAPAQVQPTISTPPPTYNPVFNNDVKIETPTQVQSIPTPPSTNNDVRSETPAQEQQKPLPPQPYNSLLNGDVIQGTSTQPKPIKPPYAIKTSDEISRDNHKLYKPKTDTINNTRNNINGIKATVYFINESTTNSTYDVIWDGVLICSISPGQTSSGYSATANVKHTLLFRVKYKNTIACAFHVPPLGNTSYNFTCSY